MLRYGGQQLRCRRCSYRETTWAGWVGDLLSFRWTHALAASPSSRGPPTGVGVACFFNISQFSHHHDPQIIISPSPLPVPPFPSGRRRPPPLPPPPARPLPPPGGFSESAMLPNSGGNSDNWRSVANAGPKITLILRRVALEEL